MSYPFVWKETWPEASKHTCPSCGAVVLLDEKEKRVAHQEPMCSWWSNILGNAVAQGQAKLHGMHAIDYPERKGSKS